MYKSWSVPLCMHAVFGYGPPSTHSPTHCLFGRFQGLLLIMTVVFIISRNDLLTEKGQQQPNAPVLSMSSYFAGVKTNWRGRRNGRNALTTLKSCRNKNEISRGGTIIVIHPILSIARMAASVASHKAIHALLSFRRIGDIIIIYVHIWRSVYYSRCGTHLSPSRIWAIAKSRPPASSKDDTGRGRLNGWTDGWEIWERRAITKAVVTVAGNADKLGCCKNKHN